MLSPLHHHDLGTQVRKVAQGTTQQLRKVLLLSFFEDLIGWFQLATILSAGQQLPWVHV